MGEADYIIYLSKDYTDRYRHYHRIERGKVREFRIQYEALIEGHWYAIVRYDTAHGRPHKDLMHPDGSQTKEGFFGYTPNAVLTYGERDIKRNWQRYRAQYEKEMRQ
jgi:hypothetical protein